MNNQTTTPFSNINTFRSPEELHQINYYIPWKKATRLINEEGIFLKADEAEKKRKEELEKRQKEKEEREKNKILVPDKPATFWMTHINSGNMYRSFIKNPGSSKSKLNELSSEKLYKIKVLYFGLFIIPKSKSSKLNPHFCII